MIKFVEKSVSSLKAFKPQALGQFENKSNNLHFKEKLSWDVYPNIVPDLEISEVRWGEVIFLNLWSVWLIPKKCWYKKCNVFYAYCIISLTIKTI